MRAYIGTFHWRMCFWVHKMYVIFESLSRSDICDNICDVKLKLWLTGNPGKITWCTRDLCAVQKIHKVYLATNFNGISDYMNRIFDGNEKKIWCLYCWTNKYIDSLTLVPLNNLYCFFFPRLNNVWCQKYYWNANPLANQLKWNFWVNNVSYVDILNKNYKLQPSRICV